MKKIRGSSPAAGVFLLALSALAAILLLGILEIDRRFAQDTDAKIGVLLAIGIPFSLGLIRLHVFYLGPEGISHKWLGICYRVTPWTKIRDVIRVPVGKGEIGLWVTCGQAPVLRPTAYGNMPDSLRISFDWMRGKYFVLSNTPKVIAGLERFYWPLDFDCQDPKAGRQDLL